MCPMCSGYVFFFFLKHSAHAKCIKMIHVISCWMCCLWRGFPTRSCFFHSPIEALSHAHICNCGLWMCTAEFCQKLSIRQDQLKTWEVHIHFTCNAFVSIPGQIRGICFHTQLFFPSHSGAYQHHIIFTKFTKCIQLQNHMTMRQQITHVEHVGLQQWNVALRIDILSESHGISITSQKHCMVPAGSNLRVSDARFQGWNVTFSIAEMRIISASNCAAITSQEHRMLIACGNLGVCQPFVQRWNVALSGIIPSASNCVAITSEKNWMRKACRNLGVCYFCIQRWNVALSSVRLSTGNCAPITSDKHWVFLTPRNLSVS